MTTFEWFLTVITTALIGALIVAAFIAADEPWPGPRKDCTRREW